MSILIQSRRIRVVRPLMSYLILSLLTHLHLQFTLLGVALDFTVVGSIFTGLGIKRHLEQDAQLPLSSVSA